MSSIKQMVKDGTIKRADAHKILYADIHVEPGFNERTDGDALEAPLLLETMRATRSTSLPEKWRMSIHSIGAPLTMARP